MASTGKVRARRGHLAAAVRAVVNGMISGQRPGRCRTGRAAVVDPLERRVFLSTSSLPAWLAPSSAATWDASTGALTVTGPATIIADPGADEPLVTVSGPAAALTIQPATDTWIHLGSLSLTGGGSAELTRPDAGAFSESGSLVLELGSVGTTSTTPLLSVDAAAGSTLGIEDNDLIVRGAENYAQDFLRSVDVQAPGVIVPGGNTLDPNAYHADGLIIPGWSASAADWAVQDRTLWLAPGDVLSKYTPLGHDDAPDWANLDAPAPAPVTGPAYPGAMLVREQVGPAYPAAFFASSFEQPALASGPTPAYVSSVVVNGNDADLLGEQRSMVDDLLYTFSEPVTLDPTNAFTINVQANQPGTAPTLAWSAVNPDSSGASTMWAVTFTGPSIINRSIANGVYSLTLNTAAVTSEANPSLPAAAHNPDLFYRLYGDLYGTGDVTALDYSQFKQSMTTYNPAFDYFGSGLSSNADYNVFKKDLSVFYDGVISFNPAALRPTGLAATADGPTSVTLSWTAPSDPTVSGYTVQRWSDTSQTWTTLAQNLPATPDTFTDPTAPPGHIYEYALAAQTTLGLSSDWSLPSNDVITPTLAPANLVVLGTDASSVSLSWDAVPGATGYTVYRQDPGGGDFYAMPGQPQAGTIYGNINLGADAVYHYRVAANFPGGQSAPSAVVTARTLADPNAGSELFWDYTQSPQTVNAPIGQTGGGGAELGVQFWSYSEGYITGLQFYKSSLDTGTHVGNLWDSSGNLIATATFADESQSGWQQVDFAQPVAVDSESGLTASYFSTSGYASADAGYFDSQGAQTPSGDVVASQSGNGVALLGPSSGYPGQADADATNFWVQPVFVPASAAGSTPAPPTGLSGTAYSDSTVYLYWANATPPGASVTVLCSGGGKQFSYTVPVYQQYCWLTGLSANTTYTFQVVANDLTASSAPSDPVSVTTLAVPAPTNLTATAISESEVDLSWADHSSGTTAFTVQRSPDDSSWTNDGPSLAPGTTSFRDRQLTNGTPYYYRVVATDAAGTSAFSNIALAATPALPAPSGLTATAVSGNEVDLTWTAATPGQTRFTVQRSTSWAGPWTTVGIASPGATAFQDTGANQAATNYYRVAATDAAGMSAFSYVSAATPYSTPTVASAAAAAQSSVTGTTDTLSVLGAIAGGPESALSYSWSVTSGPAGATFSPNGTNAAKNSTITFAAAGTYTIQATIENATASATSSVTVTVEQTLTSISLSPSQPAVLPGTTQQFTATGYDQFGAPLNPQPAFNWSATGTGSIDQNGLFTAGSQLGQSTVQVTAAGLFAGETVLVNDGMYKVTLGGTRSIDDQISGSLSVTSPGWIPAASPADAVRRAVGGTVTVTDTELPGTSGTATFPDDLGTNFTLVGPSASGTPLTYTGTIELTFPFEGYEEFFQDVTVQQEPNVYLTAYRTGGNFGLPVSTTVKASDDPSQYIVLVNDNYDQNLSGGLPDDSASTAPVQGGQMQTNPDGSPLDPDFGRLRLNLLPTGITSGTVTLTPSDPSEVKLFKSNGSALTDTTLNLANPTGDLAPLASGPMDVWFEATKADPDFTFTMTYADSSGSTAAQDQIHVDLVEWTFVGSDGTQMAVAAPLWKDALIAAATATDGPLQDPSGADGPGSDASSEFFRAKLVGMATGASPQIEVRSDSDPTDTYSDQLVALEDGSGSMEQQNFTVLYNGAMYLSTDDTPLTGTQRAEIQSNLMLDAVHNPGATTTITTANDKQSREMTATNFVQILIAQGMDVAQVGGHVIGIVDVPAADASWTIQVQCSNGQTVTGSGNSVKFDFVPSSAGYMTITAAAGRSNVPGGAPRQINPELPYSNAALIDVLPAGQSLSTWTQQAWSALHVSGIVPADPITRNRRITELYTSQFDSGSDPNNPNKLNPYEWFGLAAFVSKTAGDGMATAFTYGFNLPHPGAPDPHKVYSGLGQGNLAIFMDMYPQAEAYAAGGMADINGMFNSGQITQEQQQGWQSIDNGVAQQNQGLVSSGVKNLADVEQTVTLQAVINSDFTFWSQISTSWSAKFFPLKSGIPGDQTDFNSWCSQNPGIVGATYNFALGSDRYQWFVNAIFPAWQAWRSGHNSIDLQTLLKGGY